MADTRRLLAVRILWINTVILGLLAITAWAGVLPVVESSRQLIAAAFAFCAVLDAILALVITSRT
jgi:hypothetical protein